MDKHDKSATHATPATPAAPVDHARPITVRATKDGIDATAVMRRAGEVFTIPGDCHPGNLCYAGDDPRAGKPHPRAGTLVYFSDKWMEKVDASAAHARIAPPPPPVFDPHGKTGKPTGSTDVLS